MAGGLTHTRKCKLTIQASKITSALTDFPVLITKDTLPSEIFDADGSNPAQNGGGDIRFLAGDDSTQLPCEIVSFVTDNNPALGTCEIWVKVSSISASVNTDIYIYYNTTGTDSQPAVTDTYGRNAVWSDYEVVLHCQDTSDSTGNYTPATVGTLNQRDGPFGSEDGAYGDVASVAGQLKVTSISPFNLPWTQQVWGYVATNNTTRLICAGDQSSTGNQINLGTFYTSSYGAELACSGTTPITTSNHVGQNTWRMYHGVLTAVDDRELFVNGGTEGTGTDTSTFTGTDSISLLRSSDSTPFSNRPNWVDEGRLRFSALSADWISAEFNNQNDPATFLIEGTAEDAGAAGSTTAELAAGSFAISGAALGTLYNQRAAIAAGAFTLSGIDIDTDYNQRTAIDAGAFTWSGVDIGTLYNQRTALTAGSFALSGIDIGTLYNQQTQIDAGAFTISGTDITTLQQLRAALDSAGFTISGIDIDTDYNQRTALDVGAFTISGTDITTTVDTLTPTASLDAGAFTISGIDIGTLYNQRTSLDAGSFTWSGIDLDTSRALLSSIDAGVFILTGTDIDEIYNQRAALEAGGFVITGAAVTLTAPGAGAIQIVSGVQRINRTVAAVQRINQTIEGVQRLS